MKESKEEKYLILETVIQLDIDNLSSLSCNTDLIGAVDSIQTGQNLVEDLIDAVIEEDLENFDFSGTDQEQDRRDCWNITIEKVSELNLEDQIIVNLGQVVGNIGIYECHIFSIAKVEDLINYYKNNIV